MYRTVLLCLCVGLIYFYKVKCDLVKRENMQQDAKHCCYRTLDLAGKLDKLRNKSYGCKGNTPEHPTAFTALSTFSSGLPNGPIPFDKVIANVGNSYNQSTGKFTAPVSGLYSISVSIMGLHGNSIHVNIRKNGQELARLWTHGGGRGEVASHTLNLQLKHGDQMWASGTPGHKIYAKEPYNVFSGMLIASGTFNET
ncbi:complement C1q tumor necrosis factor-related protein 2-like isoform X3 [Mytilus californianus]|uniref:complement C1q tumor necrosis factor-related protein 2-like isoform X3 n=1 Tax=Mytilus californianus TaxID=6549 RepID=UPI0022476873|nr:complement C1q tumor necrosis factor-related protein 2-like isoform X3 [Mytilus californianus]